MKRRYALQGLPPRSASPMPPAFPPMGATGAKSNISERTATTDFPLSDVFSSHLVLTFVVGTVRIFVPRTLRTNSPGDLNACRQ